jgi:hypothetical protein
MSSLVLTAPVSPLDLFLFCLTAVVLVRPQGRWSRHERCPQFFVRSIDE